MTQPAGIDPATRSRTGRILRRTVVLVVAIPILLAGLVLLVIPGPGTPLLLAGLAILAIEFPWARTQMDRLKATARRAMGREEESNEL